MKQQIGRNFFHCFFVYHTSVHISTGVELKFGHTDHAPSLPTCYACDVSSYSEELHCRLLKLCDFVETHMIDWCGTSPAKIIKPICITKKFPNAWHCMVGFTNSWQTWLHLDLTAKHCYFRCSRPPDVDVIKTLIDEKAINHR